jgi:hypothetical protein
MQLRIGILGLALVGAFVAGSVAQQPTYYTGPSPDRPAAEGSETGSLANESVVAADLSDVQMAMGAAKSGPQVGSAGQMIGFNGFDGSGSQIITLVHTGKMQIAVYHIDRSSQIRLVSSRPIDADFSLSLNVTAPLPGQIRLLGGQVK